MKLFRRIEIRFKDLTFNKKMNKQRYKKGYADCDCWGMHYWFTDTFPKMIRNLRDMKHSYPELAFEEINNYSIEFLELAKKEITESDNNEEYDINDPFYKWKIILTRIAYCLEEADDDKCSYKNKYGEEYYKQAFGNNQPRTFKEWWNNHFKISKTDNKGKPLLYEMIVGDIDEELKENYIREELNINNYRNKMKDEAFDLLKKYFYNLWD